MNLNCVVWSRKLCCRNKIITTWTLSRSFDISITPLNTLDRSIKNVRTIPSKRFYDKMLGKRKRERERERSNGICKVILRNLSFQKHGES